MAVFLVENIWNTLKTDDVLIFTANSVVVKGRLVMGKGFAKEVKDRYPDIPVKLGHLIGEIRRYGLVLTKANTGRVVGAFQVKYHFKDRALLSLIEFSTNKLLEYASTNKDKIIKMNFPAIGYGWLQASEDEIRKTLEKLPDNVHIYKLI